MSHTSDIIARHDKYMTRNYPRYPLAMIKGHACTLTDAENNQYLDLFSGFGAGILGHCHPDLVKAASDQAAKLWHVGNLLHTEPQTTLAQHIAEKGFNGKSFFCHSGSDANEAAFKLARLYGQNKRYKIISATQSFHGRGFAAMMATGQEKVRHGFAPLLDGFDYVPFNDFDALKNKIDDQAIAIILEPIQGEGGVNIPNPEYLKNVAALCQEKDLLLIMDEVWTGCARTGKWFAYQHFDITPDILTLGKAVGAGLPLGVMCASERIANQFDFNHYGGVPHATTLGGNCLSTAVSAKMFEVIDRDNLLPQATHLGNLATTRLQQFAQNTDKITDIRGIGLFIGIQTTLSAADIVKVAMANGLLIGSAQSNILRLAPPLIVTEDELNQGLDILEDVIANLN